MEKPSSYCQAVMLMEPNNPHGIYHDTQYGFPILDDDELFGRLILEINQAGLSWTTILNKQDNFRKAYHQFNIKKIAAYKEKDRVRLLEDAGIIRNRLKVDAVIHDANVILGLQKEHGSFKNWLDNQNPKTKAEWTNLFKKTFKFTGCEIVNEFLMSTGYLEGAHEKGCEIYNKVIESKPKWMECLELY